MSGVLRLAVLALAGFLARAEMRSQEELPNSTDPTLLATPAALTDIQSLAADTLPPQCLQMTAEERTRSAACTYSEKEATKFAALCSAAFCATRSWKCGKPCSAVPDMRSVRNINKTSLGAHAFVGRLGDACVVAFRGTDSLKGWRQDFLSLILADLPGCAFQGQGCRVGTGFLQSYDALAEDIRAKLEKIGCKSSTPLYITGHSLGAALATLALFDLNRLGYNISKAYTFGSPRVGDAAFVGAFNQAMASCPVHRVTTADDPVVYLPFKDPFHHVGTEIYYQGGTTRGYRICDGSGEDPTCQDKHNRNSILSLAPILLKCVIPSTCGHFTYLRPLMTFSISGNSCSRSRESTIFLP